MTARRSEQVSGQVSMLDSWERLKAMAKAVYCKDCIHHEECNAKRKEMGIVTFVEGLVDCEGYAVSKMIQCDQCKKTMYTDAREDKGAYVSMTADDPLYGFSSFHLCRKCYAEKFPWLVDERG